MSYQPLYAVVSDNQGGYRHSLALRGRVDSVSFWLNSWFGEVMRVDSRLIDGKTIVLKPDLRKVKKEQRKAVLKQYGEEANREDKVIVDIDIPANKKFEFRINGVALSYERLKLMEELKLKRLDMQIEALKKLGEQDKKVLQLAKVIMQ